MMLSTASQTRDFVILGPTLAGGNKRTILEAIHSLYFLPENFKMVFTGSAPVDQDFYKEVVSLVKRDALAERVHFASGVGASHAVVVQDAAHKTTKKEVTGSSAEALASAILNVARASS